MILWIWFEFLSPVASPLWLAGFACGSFATVMSKSRPFCCCPAWTCQYILGQQTKTNKLAGSYYSWKISPSNQTEVNDTTDFNESQQNEPRHLGKWRNETIANRPPFLVRLDQIDICLEALKCSEIQATWWNSGWNDHLQIIESNEAVI